MDQDQDQDAEHPRKLPLRNNLPRYNVNQYCPLDQALMKLQQVKDSKKLFQSRPPSPSRQSRRLQDIIASVEATLTAMLNSKELTKLLNANVHPRLFPQWL